MLRLFFIDIDELFHVSANRELTIFVKRTWEPESTLIGQRTKASVEMIKAGIDQLDRDDEATEHVRDRAMRLDGGAEFVTGIRRVAVNKRIAFGLEIPV